MAGTSGRTRKLRWVALAGLVGAGVWLARSRRGGAQLLRQWPAPDPAAPGAGGLTTGFLSGASVSETVGAEPAVPEPAESPVVASRPEASEPVDSAAAVSGPVASPVVASKPVLSGPVVSERVVFEPVVSERVASPGPASRPTPSPDAGFEPVEPAVEDSEWTEPEPGESTVADTVAAETMSAGVRPTDEESGDAPRMSVHSLLSPPEPATPTDPLPSGVGGDALFAAAAPATAADRSAPRPTPSPRRRTPEQVPDYGPGSAAPLPDGAAPGPEYTIKGNADSMLFHRQDSPYYSRTKAEVWFRTATDARAAGFTEWLPKDRRPE